MLPGSLPTLIFHDSNHNPIFAANIEQWLQVMSIPSRSSLPCFCFACDRVVTATAPTVFQ